jgi:hypothetical protein
LWRLGNARYQKRSVTEFRQGRGKAGHYLSDIGQAIQIVDEIESDFRIARDLAMPPWSGTKGFESE